MGVVRASAGTSANRIRQKGTGGDAVLLQLLFYSVQGTLSSHTHMRLCDAAAASQRSWQAGSGAIQ